jgi:hypothetical protein
LTDIQDTPERTAPIRALILNNAAIPFAESGLLGENAPGVWLSFPTTAEKFKSALAEIGVESARYMAYTFGKFDTCIPCLRNKLRRVADANEINLLASKLAVMPEDSMETFRAVILSGRHCGSLMDIVNITENIGLFYVQPAFSVKMYGEFLRDLGKVDDLSDATAYARGVVKAENGVFTAAGYLTEESGFKRVHKTVPPEYRVAALPEAKEKMPAERPSALDKLTAAKEAVSSTDAVKPAAPPKARDPEL